MYEFLKGNGKKKWESLSISNGIPSVLKITVFCGMKCTMIHTFFIMVCISSHVLQTSILVIDADYRLHNGPPAEELSGKIIRISSIVKQDMFLISSETRVSFPRK